MRIKGLIYFVLATWPAWINQAALADSATELESARHKLAAAQNAAKSAAAEFRTLLGQGGLTQSELEDYRVYLARLEQLVVENCKAVLMLKLALNDDTPEDGCMLGSVTSTGAVSFPDERTEGERVIVLDGQLARSMSEFDELLLREMEELKRRQSSAPDATGGDARGVEGGDRETGEGGEVAATNSGEAGGLATDSSDEAGSAAASSGEAGTDQQGQSEQQGQEQAASTSRQGGDQGSHGMRGRKNGKTTTVTKRDEPPAAGDDDIVARQLREAAEAETDPELREKLWEEYRRYKADTAAKSN